KRNKNIRYIIKEDKIMLKSVMFDLDDTLLWDEKSIEKAFEATCEIAANKYNIDPKELEKNVRISAEAIYPQYETYEFVSNIRSEEHTSELQSRFDLVCRLLLEKK